MTRRRRSARKVSLKRWIAALRDGKYKQGRNNLRTSETRFCCLGVGANLVNPDAWKKIGKGWVYCERSNRATGILTSDLVKNLSVVTPMGRFFYSQEFLERVSKVSKALGKKLKKRWSSRVGRWGHHADALIHLNDSGYTFKEIAIVIEAKPDQLLKRYSPKDCSKRVRSRIPCSR